MHPSGMHTCFFDLFRLFFHLFPFHLVCTGLNTYFNFLQGFVFLLCESFGAVHDVDEGVNAMRKRQKRLGDLSLHFVQSPVRVEQSRSVHDVYRSVCPGQLNQNQQEMITGLARLIRTRLIRSSTFFL